MHNVTPVSTFTDPVQVLDDGDDVDGANTQVSIQALVNRTEYVNDQITIIGSKDTASGYVGLDTNSHAAVSAAASSGVSAIAATGNGAGNGLDGIGGATGAGVTGAGGASSGSGVVGTGTATGASGVAGTGGPTSGKGVVGTGTGTGAGIQGTGGSTGTGVNGIGGASSGSGVTGSGTAAGASGVVGSGGPTSGKGVVGTGTGTGAGISGTGGVTAGSAGVEGLANGATVVAPGTVLGGHFSGAGTGTGATQDAVQIDQNLFLAGSNPGATTAFKDRLTPANVPKAWANVQTSGSGGATIEDGFNVASVSVTSSAVVVTLATPMANTNYAVIPTASSGSSSVVIADASNFSIFTGNDPATAVTIVMFAVFGKQ